MTTRSRRGRVYGGLHIGAALAAAGLSLALAGAMTAGPAYARPVTVPIATDSVPITDETVPVTEPATTTTLAPTTTAASTSIAPATSTTMAPAVLPAHVLPSSGGSSTSTVAIGGLLIAVGAGTIAVTRARRVRTGS
jgi:LPXTG-motif cell wall-anchored protein